MYYTQSLDPISYMINTSRVHEVVAAPPQFVGLRSLRQSQDVMEHIFMIGFTDYDIKQLISCPAHIR